MRKKILILFPLKHIAFSPTTLGIYDALAVDNDVTIYAPRSDEFNSNNNRNILYFDFNTEKTRKLKALPSFMLLKIFDFFGKKNPLSELNIYDYVRYLEYKIFLQNLKNDYDEIIAVDVIFLYLASLFFKNVHFLSLEISGTERLLLDKIKNEQIKSVVIQTQERYDHMFPNRKLKTFFIQNAPIFVKENNTTKIKNSLLLNGTALPCFGLYHCLNFIRNNNDYTLTIKGTILKPEFENIKANYVDLLESKKLILHTEYMEAAELLDYIAHFEIGFCFYDLSYPEINTFNYNTAPSGKMFAYFAAGVPVVAMNLLGQKCVQDFEAGILIDNFDYNTILQAIEKIKSNYEFYRANCFKAARHFSFDKNVAPYVDFLTE